MDINGIHHISSAHAISAPHFNEGIKRAGSASSMPIQDEIEISTTAERLSAVDGANRADSSSEIRYDLVNRVREEIANGTYDTHERLDIALERLLSRIG